MPTLADVVDPARERPSPLDSIEKQKIRSKLLRHNRLKPSRLAEWWTTGRLGGEGLQRIMLRGQGRSPFPLPVWLAYMGKSEGRAPGQWQSCEARRELSRHSADKILSTARERVRSPGLLSHGDRLHTPKTADTSAGSGQSELVFFWGGGLVHDLSKLQGGRGCGPRPTPYLDLHKIQRYPFPPCQDKTQNTTHNHTKRGCPSRAGLHVNRRASLWPRAVI
jgi:hypothetical protein